MGGLTGGMMAGWIDGQFDWWMVGCKDRQLDVLMERWMNKFIFGHLKK